MRLINLSTIIFSASLLILQAKDSPASFFDELGGLFLWGILGAIGAAILVAFIRIKILDRRSAASDYTSINPSRHGDKS